MDMYHIHIKWNTWINKHNPKKNDFIKEIIRKKLPPTFQVEISFTMKRTFTAPQPQPRDNEITYNEVINE
jgi:hypothetical protein